MKTLNEMVIELVNMLLYASNPTLRLNDAYQDAVYDYLVEHASDLRVALPNNPYIIKTDIVINKEGAIEPRTGAVVAGISEDGYVIWNEKTKITLPPAAKANGKTFIISTPHQEAANRIYGEFAKASKAFDTTKPSELIEALKTPAKKPTKCECGSEHVGSPRHSVYCPKYKETL